MAAFLVLVVMILVIPSILVVGFSNEGVESSSVNVGSDFTSEKPVSSVMREGIEDETVISVFRSEKEVIEEVLFEDYIVGVVAMEMPARYDLDALKAQALAARTYIIQHLTSENVLGLPDGADVTDTELHQVYASEDELRERWGAEYEKNIARVKQAVFETQGKVITFNGQPITASYFSTSNGYTENSEDYWTHEFPYLRSVESPWDLDSPRYLGEKTIPVSDFQSRLSVTLSGQTAGTVLDRTAGGNVARVEIGGKEFTGREIRNLLDLDSTDFTLTRRGNNIIIETRGWGHGVGMSQFGADGMAKEGYTYQEIIEHYYAGVTISNVADVIGNMTADETDASSGKQVSAAP
ncbi:stage II sporulation protein D [Evansella sp. AB-rgal1]|uniref:stage II sporulation protein D n=1 Tax=Evansella sp. AB-rgal1 TaxID=3242696 RepID=UPI00359E99BF